MDAIQVNPLFSMLQDTEKKVINDFIDFAYERSHAPNEETQNVIDEMAAGQGIIGRFSSVEALMEELDA